MQINIVRLEMVRDRTIEYGNSQIKSPEDVARLGYKLLDRADREVSLIVCLNANNNINAVHVVSIGSLTSSIVHPREVFKAAILSNSKAIALLHNHPSGNLKPSAEDIEITERLVKAGKLLDIQIIDHVIIGDREFYSFLLHEACDFG